MGDAHNTLFCCNKKLKIKTEKASISNGNEIKPRPVVEPVFKDRNYFCIHIVQMSQFHEFGICGIRSVNTKLLVKFREKFIWKADRYLWLEQILKV